MLRQTLLVPSTRLGPKTRFLLLSDTCGFFNVRCLLWREDGSVVYSCCWPSPAQSFSGPSPAERITIFYYFRFETPPTWRTRSLYLYPPGIGWPSYTPWHWVHCSSPPTPRRVNGEGVRAQSQSESELLYNWLFTANQFVLAPSPLRLKATDFSQPNAFDHSPYVTSSCTRKWGCLLWICQASSSVRIAHVACYWKFLLCTIHKSSVNVGFAKQTCLSYVSYATTAAKSLERS
jgi:hypothetical protein